MDSFNKGVEVSTQILNWIFQAVMAVFGFFAPIALGLIALGVIAVGIAFIWGAVEAKVKR